MRSLPLVFLAVTLVVPPAAAQDGDNAPQRTALRERIEQTFLARAREEMSLTDQQSAKLQEVTRRIFRQRRELEATNRRLNAALAREMRPGVAADPRMLRGTLDSLVTLRIASAELYRDEQRELSTFLSEVQRAQFHVLRERLLNRLEDVRIQRAPAARRRP
ncbi:MAG: hypothetical protein ABJB33_06125 [Gemmatimonadota bacterium]